MAINQALDAARALALNPSLAPAMRQARLPEDIALLLQFLAGEAVLSDLRRDKGLLLHDLIENYVIVVMFFPGASPTRVLGVTAGATREQFRAHMRWLMLWLHPDRAGSSWRASYSARVLEAWRQVSSAPSEIPMTVVTPPRRRRPRTRSVKLSWVPSPVARGTRSRSLALLTPITIALTIAFVLIYDNPLRQWAATAFIPYASEIFSGEARSGL